DAEQELLQRLTDLRAAVVGRVRDAAGVSSLRAALLTVFEGITLYQVDGKLFLLPEVRADALASTDLDALVQAKRVPLNLVPSTSA
ncbi:MAG: hypothetical protein ACXVZ3_04510, partial [Gaiellaceae bacterium]